MTAILVILYLVVHLFIAGVVKGLLNRRWKYNESDKGLVEAMSVLWPLLLLEIPLCALLMVIAWVTKTIMDAGQKLVRRTGKL